MGISDLEESARRTKDNQRRAELLAQLREIEGNEGSDDRRPTEFEKSGTVIVNKMANPQNLHDRQIHTNIPKQILTNLMMMDGIEEGLRKLIYADDLKVKGNTVTLLRKIDISKPFDKKTNCLTYKTMTYQAYRRGLFYADAMQGFSGNLMELLMSVDGWRSEQEVTMLGSVAQTEQQKIGADNQQNWIKRQISKVIS
jgi:hypothetical protein